MIWPHMLIRACGHYHISATLSPYMTYNERNQHSYKRRVQMNHVLINIVEVEVRDIIRIRNNVMRD